MHIYIYSTQLQKKNEIVWSAAAWMEPRDYHAKWSEQDNREKQLPYDIPTRGI